MRYIHPTYITSSTSLGLLLLLAAMGCGSDNSSSGEDMTTSPVEDMGMDTGQDSEEMGCQGSTCTPDQGGGDVCGDAMQTGQEECDDGNLEAGDGCDAQCREEPAQAVCGDGMQTGDEACDEGATPPSACPYGEISCQVCTSTCTFTAGTTVYCGDGILQQDEGEICDDGQENSEDGPCLPDCTRIVPVKVFGGGYNTYVLMSNGTVYGWGDNTFGQLGNRDPVLKGEPAVLSGFNGIIDIADGSNSMCALSNTGEVWCIGRGEKGELGHGQFSSSITPVKVMGLMDIVSIKGNNRHYCALDNEGSVWCWGKDEDGALGTPGDFTNQAIPKKVDLKSKATSVMTGISTCVLLESNETWCWGENRNDYGEESTFRTDRSPERVFDLDAIELIGLNQSVIFKSSEDNEYYGIGDNRQKQLNKSTSESIIFEPIKIENITSNYKVFASGHEHACSISNEGQLACWGGNLFGQISTNEAGVWYAKVEEVSDVKHVGTGGLHTCAIDGMNDVWCWGTNKNGQLGFEPSDEIFGPQKVELWPTP